MSYLHVRITYNIWWFIQSIFEWDVVATMSFKIGWYLQSTFWSTHVHVHLTKLTTNTHVVGGEGDKQRLGCWARLLG